MPPPTLLPPLNPPLCPVPLPPPRPPFSLVSATNRAAAEAVTPCAAEPSALPSGSVALFNKPASRTPSAKLFRRNKPVLRTPSLACKNCHILAAEVKVVRKLLDIEVVRKDELKQLHSSSSRETMPPPPPLLPPLHPPPCPGPLPPPRPPCSLVSATNRAAAEVVTPCAAEPSALPSGSVTLLNKPASRTPSAKLFRRNKPVLRTPSFACKNCHILAAEVKVVRKLLDIEVFRNGELKQLHSSSSRETAAKYKRRKPFSLSKASQYVKLVKEFKEHTVGSCPTHEMWENANQRVSHVITFLRFMTQPAVPRLNLLFLNDYGRIRKFTAHLSERYLNPMTIRSYLTDAVVFVKYIMNTVPEGVKIDVKTLNALQVELRARVRDVSRRGDGWLGAAESPVQNA